MLTDDYYDYVERGGREGIIKAIRNICPDRVYSQKYLLNLWPQEILDLYYELKYEKGVRQQDCNKT